MGTTAGSHSTESLPADELYTILPLKKMESYCADGIHRSEYQPFAEQQRKQSDGRISLTTRCESSVGADLPWSSRGVRGFVCWEGLGRFGEQVRAGLSTGKSRSSSQLPTSRAPHRRQRVFVAAWDVSDTNRERVRLILRMGLTATRAQVDRLGSPSTWARNWTTVTVADSDRRLAGTAPRRVYLTTARR